MIFDVKTRSIYIRHISPSAMGDNTKKQEKRRTAQKAAETEQTSIN